MTDKTEIAINSSTNRQYVFSPSRIRKLIAVIACFALALVCFAACGNSDGDTELPEIYGIVALDTEVRYDGASHTVRIDNALDGDVIYYSENDGGEWSVIPPSYSLPGEYVVYYKVERAGYAEFVSSVKLVIARGVLDGISASDATVIYDGLPHSITVIGADVGDTVEYSLDGVIFTRDCALTEIGEYTVYYRVSNACGDFADDCTLTVLPDLSGLYVNAVGGIVSIARDAAEMNGRAVMLVYGVDGRGTLGDLPFELADDALVVDGASFRKQCDGEYVYKIKVNGSVAYAVGGATLEISVEFRDGAASVSADGECLLTVDGCNYCESSTCELARVYENSDVTANVTANGEIAEAEFVLSTRRIQTVEIADMQILYDGAAHAPRVEYDGEILYLRDGRYVSSAPEFTEVGKYVVDAVLTVDGSLPKLVTFTVEIVPDISGVYFDAHTVITVDGYTATVNGVTASCVFTDGDWHINGKRASVTSDGLSIDGESYAEAVGGVIAVVANGEWNVLPSDVDNLTVTVDTQITVKDERGNELFRMARKTNDVTVKLNGAVCTPISDEPVEYLFGTSDLHSQTVTVLEIVAQSR